MARFNWLGKLGLGTTVAGAGVAAGAVTVASQVGPDDTIGGGLETAARTAMEPMARAEALANFESIWSTIEQIFKAIAVATGGSLGGTVMNYARTMQGLDPIGRNSDGRIDLNKIDTIDHTGNPPSTPGATPVGPEGSAPQATEASMLSADTLLPLAAMGPVALGGKYAYDAYKNANSPDGLMKRAISAEAAGKTDRAADLLDRAADAETRAGKVASIADDLPRLSSRFGKVAAVGLLAAGGAYALTSTDAEASTDSPETVAASEPGFFESAFQTVASFGTGVTSGVLSIPEGVYDLADKYLAWGYLPGDENANGTSEVIYDGARTVGIDIDNHQTAAALGELASIAVPVAGVAGAFTKASSVTRIIGATERVSDVAGTYELGKIGVNIAATRLGL